MCIRDSRVRRIRERADLGVALARLRPLSGAVPAASHQMRSYVIALEGAPLTDGMLISDGGGFSFRTYRDLSLIHI